MDYMLKRWPRWPFIGGIPANGFRCEWGAETYAAFRSVVSTAKDNRASVLDTIRFVLAAKLPAGPIAGMRRAITGVGSRAIIILSLT